MVCLRDQATDSEPVIIHDHKGSRNNNPVSFGATQHYLCLL